MSHILVPPQSEILPGKIADWRRALGRHYKRLGPVSRQRRFMMVLPDNSLQLVADRANPDVVLGIKAENRIIGVLELFKGDDGHAEIGISVEDRYQGQGFGKALFLDGLAAADKLEVRTADLYFASENQGIRGLVIAAGGKIMQHGAECEAQIDIPHFIMRHDLARHSKGFGAKQLLH